MPTFVHLTSDDNLKNITKNGLKISNIHDDKIKKGIFCMPVINDFYATHQWLREIRRFNNKNIIGVYFKISDDEPVWFGFYNKEHKLDTASMAFNEFLESEDKLGFQVVLPRKLMPREVKKIKHLPQIIGWRYYPDAHGKDLCLCPACLRKGEFRANIIKEQKYYELVTDLRHAKEEDKPGILMEIGGILEFSHGRIKDYSALLPFLESENKNTLISTINALSQFKNEEILKVLMDFLTYNDFDVKNVCADAIFRLKGSTGFKYIEPYQNDDDLKGIINEYKEIYEE